MKEMFQIEGLAGLGMYVYMYVDDEDAGREGGWGWGIGNALVRKGREGWKVGWSAEEVTQESAVLPINIQAGQ